MGAAVSRAGAEVLYSGRFGTEFIADEQWDVVGLVRYPSYRAMVSLFEDPATREAMEELRRSTLAESRFMLTSEQNIFGAIQE